MYTTSKKSSSVCICLLMLSVLANVQSITFFKQLFGHGPTVQETAKVEVAKHMWNKNGKVLFIFLFQHFESRGTIYSYYEIGLKPAVVGCLTNAIAPLPIALESCSRAQTDGPAFCSALEKNFLVGGCGFFVSDVKSEVVFGSFWLMLPGLGPNR